MKKIRVLYLFFLVSLSAKSFDSIMIPSFNKSELFVEHLEELHNLDLPKKEVLLCFSAVPGMDVAKLAKEIESRLDGVRVGFDDSRELLKLHGWYDEFVGEVRLDNYLNFILLKLMSSSKNGFIIFERPIDNIYEQINNLANFVGYRIFVLKIREDIGEVSKRLNLGEKSSFNYFLSRYNQFPSVSVDFEFYLDNPDFSSLVLELKDVLGEFDNSYYKRLKGCVARFRRSVLAKCALWLLHRV